MADRSDRPSRRQPGNRPDDIWELEAEFKGLGYDIPQHMQAGDHAFAREDFRAALACYERALRALARRTTVAKELGMPKQTMQEQRERKARASQLAERSFDRLTQELQYKYQGYLTKAVKYQDGSRNERSQERARDEYWCARLTLLELEDLNPKLVERAYAGEYDSISRKIESLTNTIEAPGRIWDMSVHFSRVESAIRHGDALGARLAYDIGCRLFEEGSKNLADEMRPSREMIELWMGRIDELEARATARFQGMW